MLSAAVIALGVVACEPDDPAQSTRTIGLLVLTAGAGSGANLTAMTGTADGTVARPLTTPGAATTWMAAGRAGVLVATLADGSLHISSPASGGAGDEPLAWRELEPVDADGDPPPSPAWFPAWDPEGGRFAALTGDLAGGERMSLTLIDPTTATSFTTDLATHPLAAAPAWTGEDELAIVDGASDAPTSSVLDTTTGVRIVGPAGDRRIATSADARVVAMTAGAGSPVVVRATDAWLAEDGTSLGSVDAPAEGATAASIALDRTGERLAIAWLLPGGAVRVDVHDGADGWRRISSETHDDGALGAVVGWLR